MKTAYIYPYGAVTTLKEVRKLANQIVYIVIGEGRNTDVYPIKISPVYSCTSDGGKYCNYFEDGKTRRLYLENVNIGNHPGMNYMFSKREDAEEYAEWAIENTKELPLFSFYGIDFS